MDLGKDLRTEIVSHRKIWEKRYKFYQDIYSDVTGIDYALKDLVKRQTDDSTRIILPPAKVKYLEIDELQYKK